MKPLIKYGIIAAAWLVYIIVVISSQSKKADTQSNEPSNQVETEVEENNTANTDSERSDVAEKHLYDNAEVRDVMNGTHTEKLGEYAVINADSSACTEEALTDLYYNYFSVNTFNRVMVIYSDKNDGTGVYVSEGIVNVNDNFEQDEYGDYSVVESPDEITYVPNDDKTLTKMVYDEEESMDTEESETVDADGVDPELKEFLDSYEAFMDGYCEFMETYDSSDAAMILKYSELMTQYADFVEKADAYDTETMSTADSAYYLEVMARVEVKLAETAYTTE